MRPLFDRTTLAAYLSITPRTLDRWRTSGNLPAPFRLPTGGLRWQPEVIDQWLGLKPPSSPARQPARHSRSATERLGA